MTYEYPPYSRPIEVKGGIKAGSKRGAFGSSWWSKRWLQTLDEFEIGARLDRGRSYARRGQVMSIDVRSGIVKAKVQGSRERPYSVSIEVRIISPENWKLVLQEFTDQPIIAASLLSGRMPDDVDDTFHSIGLSMFPERENDLETDCSCPDYSNPCKHVAAVYLLLGEEFDRDPFLIFRLRGLELDRLLGDDFRRAAQTLEAPFLAAEPLPSDSEDFWLNPLARLDEKDYAGPAEPPEADASLPQQLGRFPFWRGDQDFATSLQGIYRAASRRAKEVYEDQHNLTSGPTKAGLTTRIAEAPSISK